MLAKQASVAVPPCKTPRRTRFLPLRLHPAQAPAIRTLVLPIPLWCLSWRLRRCRPHPRAEGCGSRESPPQRSGFAQSLEPIFENGGSAILMSAATFSPSCSISLHLPCKAAALSAAEIPRYRGIISIDRRRDHGDDKLEGKRKHRATTCPFRDIDPSCQSSRIYGRILAIAFWTSRLSRNSWRKLSKDCGWIRRFDWRDLSGKLGQHWVFSPGFPSVIAP